MFVSDNIIEPFMYLVYILIYTIYNIYLFLFALKYRNKHFHFILKSTQSFCTREVSTVRKMTILGGALPTDTTFTNVTLV